MTPNDVLYFQVIAGIATLCLGALCLLLFKVAQRLDQQLSPLLDDLQAGASGFRQAGQVAVDGAQFAWSLLFRKVRLLLGR